MICHLGLFCSCCSFWLMLYHLPGCSSSKTSWFFSFFHLPHLVSHLVHHQIQHVLCSYPKLASFLYFFFLPYPHPCLPIVISYTATTISFKDLNWIRLKPKRFSLCTQNKIQILIWTESFFMICFYLLLWPPLLELCLPVPSSPATLIFRSSFNLKLSPTWAFPQGPCHYCFSTLKSQLKYLFLRGLPHHLT